MLHVPIPAFVCRPRRASSSSSPPPSTACANGCTPCLGAAMGRPRPRSPYQGRRAPRMMAGAGRAAPNPRGGGGTSAMLPLLDPFTSWPRTDGVDSDADLRYDLAEHARVHREECWRRFDERGWAETLGYHDVDANRRTDYHRARVRDVHGDPDAGQQGEWRETVEVMALANELIRENANEGIYPWAVQLYSWAMAGGESRPTSLLSMVANAFGRWRRLHLEAVIVQSDLVFGLDLPSAISPAAVNDLGVLSTMVQDARPLPYEGDKRLDFDRLWRDDGVLVPSRRAARVDRPRGKTLARGPMGQSYASWMAMDPGGRPGDLLVVPEPFIHTGLDPAPLPPLVVDYLYSYLLNAGHGIWRTVVVEMTVAYAARWFNSVRSFETLVRVSPGMLDLFGQLPLDGLQRKDDTPGRAQEFVQCLEGARLFPWKKVTSNVLQSSDGLPTSVMVSYNGSDPYGFVALEELGDFPMAKRAEGLPGSADADSGGGASASWRVKPEVPPTQSWVEGVRDARRQEVEYALPYVARQREADAALEAERKADRAPAAEKLRAKIDAARSRHSQSSTAEPRSSATGADSVNADRIRQAREAARADRVRREADAQAAAPARAAAEAQALAEAVARAEARAGADVEAAAERKAASE